MLFRPKRQESHSNMTPPTEATLPQIKPKGWGLLVRDQQELIAWAAHILLMTLFCAFLVGFFSQQQSQWMTERRTAAASEAQLARFIIEQSLNRGDYASLPPLIQAWAVQRPDIAELTVTASNGARLASHHRDVGAHPLLTVRQEAHYSFRGAASITLRLDISRIDEQANALRWQLIAAFGVILFGSTTLLHLLLQRRRHVLSLAEQSRHLNETNHSLSEEIAQRARAEQERQRADRNWKALSRCGEAMIRATNEEELLTEVCRIIVDVANYRMAWVGYGDESDGERRILPKAKWGHEMGYLREVTVGWGDNALGNGPGGTAYREGRTVAVLDTQKDPDFAPWRAEALKRGYHAVLGLPLKEAGHTFGVLMINSAHPAPFGVEERQLLEDLAGDLAFGIVALRESTRVREAERSLLRSNEELEERVASRTRQLSDSLERLQRTQAQLVDAERIASLGNLVAGVAHEINTPLGVGVTALSHLQNLNTEARDAMAQGNLKKSHLTRYFEDADMMLHSLDRSLRRSSQLVRNFKLVSTDTGETEAKEINLHDFLAEFADTARRQCKKTGVVITVECPEDLLITSFPNSLTHVLTNLHINAMEHGFEGRESGEILLRAHRDNPEAPLTLLFQDNGRGMSEEQVRQIFEPFYTTKRHLGGTGLGMMAVYNIVTHLLGGSIHCHSAPDQGAQFLITLTPKETVQT
ncbi:GAF domain-containing sensor histidine kinase [Magnetofaba australis]|nr:GAF domain-containing sensor histidine kinase [Magnetofaba australis]